MHVQLVSVFWYRSVQMPNTGVGYWYQNTILVSVSVLTPNTGMGTDPQYIQYWSVYKNTILPSVLVMISDTGIGENSR